MHLYNKEHRLSSVSPIDIETLGTGLRFFTFLEYRVTIGQREVSPDTTYMYVSINPGEVPWHRFPVKPIGGAPKITNQLALCNKAMYLYNSEHVGKIIEYIKLYRILGVEKFFFTTCTTVAGRFTG